METGRKGLRLIMADDDEDDFVLMRDAFINAGLKVSLEWVKDGEELIALLGRRGPNGASNSAGARRLVILDLNMPKMDGREALRRIRSEPRFHGTAVVVMTSSAAESDVLRAYELGACSYIKKPSSFKRGVEIAGMLRRYWMDLVELPTLGGAVCAEE